VNFNSILIGSEDPDRLVTFYSKTFGEPGFSEGGYSGWQIGSGYLTVGPHDEVHGRNPEPGRILWNIETPDVRSAFEQLRGAGAEVIREPYNPGDDDDASEMLVATFADPDGNYFQLVSPM
jgi:predicted enzyme related to lactoylglutathione lyase